MFWEHNGIKTEICLFWHGFAILLPQRISKVTLKEIKIFQVKNSVTVHAVLICVLSMNYFFNSALFFLSACLQEKYYASFGCATGPKFLT